ncbi:site-specific integrase [Wohlfahrtiimonas chitiniclastica]|uniref:Site-specific integrase n=1 Tax=Wohlfahrtiimonas chitiniclastica TaxID=400946 RepID=A0AB35C0X7_9GAMM|nr:site-specific integrase [Wohlfahrtiimonas chitiniclastica]MBS7824445.1 site-specific integrase [Wohlfahrtiimonas chitiniclastica]MBS7840762.1 site-specific integrase [Wohlfahrtiimonas chitiniclastica]
MKGKVLLNDLFTSRAKVIYLNSFYLADLIWSSRDIGDGCSEYGLNFSKKSEIYPKMPVILQSNSLPWDIGNTYLLSLLTQPSLANLKTISSKAICLKYYLQYLEDTGQHFLDLPTKYYERVPQKFKKFLSESIDRHDFSIAYINNILSTVVDFYTQIEHHGLLPKSSLKNKAFTRIDKKIMVENRVGLLRNINVSSSDLRIRGGRKSEVEIGKIRDGGNLRPLTYEEQRIIFDGFEQNLASIELELMIKIALETGARQQTICTLSIGCIEKANNDLEDNPESHSVVIHAGYRYPSDTKGGRYNRLVFSRKLIEDLMNYICCSRAERRRAQSASFYGNSQDNYIFLTRSGNPYFSAQREIIARQNIQDEEGQLKSFMVTKSGQSLRTELIRFIERLKMMNESLGDFTFHDLRATSGMNIVRNLRAKGYPDPKIFDYVRQHLNHTNISTTEKYLSFDCEVDEFNDIQDSFSAIFEKGEYLDDYC